jgi:ribosome-dependent ATPase
MNEASRCDRVALMEHGPGPGLRIPSELIAGCGCATLEEAFIRYMEDDINMRSGTLEADNERKASRSSIAPERKANAGGDDSTRFRLAALPGEKPWSSSATR